MTSSELARIDREYQKEIRRQQMSDQAKMALLVGLNAQQFQTNQLLAHNLEVACQTNEILGSIAGSLDVIANVQATHFAQVQRERELKETIFQVDKFLNETTQSGDTIAAAYGVKRLFEVLDNPQFAFTTADLSDIKDKQRFDTLIVRCKKLLTELPKDQFIELQQFESLYGVYHERKETGFQANEVVTKHEYVQLPEEFRTSPAERKTSLWDSLTGKDKSKEESELDGEEGGSCLKQGCGCMLTGYGGLFLVTSLAALFGQVEGADGEKIVFSFSMTMLFLVPGIWMLYSALSRKEALKARRQKFDKKKESTEQAEQKRWEQRRKQAEVKLLELNKQVDAHNADVEKRRQQAIKIYEHTMLEMKTLLNRFLDQHPAILRFVGKVS